jgi:hypothetical protein
MPKEFGWYAFSEIDIGQKEISTDFTQVQTISYPFWDLAASAAAKNNQSTSSTNDNNEICVLAKTGKGYDEVVDYEEQCSGSNSKWEFVFCENHTKADLEVYKNKKWKKVKTIKGGKGYCDDPSFPNTFNFSGSLLEKYRIKSYGNSKFLTAYLDLKIYRKVITE